MAEKPRPVIVPSAYYHIYNRGVNRRVIFREEADFQRFLNLTRKYMKPVGEVLSYALLPNHFHLTVLMNPASQIPNNLLRKPHTLGNTFGHLQNAYSLYFNNKYKAVSGLFEKHFERKLIDSLEYFQQLVVYHHRNPESHGIINDFKQYFWTSYQELSNPLVTPYVNVPMALEKFGGINPFFEAHNEQTPLAMQNFNFLDH